LSKRSRRRAGCDRSPSRQFEIPSDSYSAKADTDSDPDSDADNDKVKAAGQFHALERAEGADLEFGILVV